MHVRLGDVMVKLRLLSAGQRDEILAAQKTSGRPFGLLAERMFGVHPRQVEQAWAEQFAASADFVDPRTERTDPEVLALVERRQAWQFRVLPLRLSGEDVLVCTTPQHIARAMRFLGWRVGSPCCFVLAHPDHLGAALARHYPMAGLRAEHVGGLAAPA